MKPHNPVKQSSGVNRAKMLIAKDLCWLEGYPDTRGGWISVPTGSSEQPIHIGRSDLRRATYTMNKLRNDFPRALPRLVGDVDLWFRLHKTLINILKSDPLDPENFPPSAFEIHPEYRTGDREKAQRLIRDSPHLQSFINSVSWRFWLRPEQLGSALKWIEANKTGFQTIVSVYGHPQANGVAISLIELKQKHGVKRGNSLLELLSSDMLSGVATYGARHYIEKLREQIQTQRGTPPKLTNSDSQWKVQAALWIQWLVTKDDRVARTAIDILALILYSTDVNAWRIWWTTAREASVSCKNKRLTKTSYDYLLRSIEDHPPELPPELFFEVLRQYSGGTNNELHNAIRSALSALPTQLHLHPVRLKLLVQWNSQLLYASQKQIRLLVTIIKEFGIYVSNQNSLYSVLRTLHVTNTGWTGIHLRYPLYQVDSMLLREMKTKEQVRSFYKCLAYMNSKSNTEFKSDDISTIITLARLLESPEQCATAMANLKQAQLGWTPDPDLVEQAIKISNDELIHFAELIKILYNYVQESADGIVAVPLVVELWTKVIGDELRAAIMDGYLPVLHNTARKARVITQAGHVFHTPDLSTSEDLASSGWIENYPALLQATLNQLARTHADAEAIASRILQKDFPDPIRMKKELRVLYQKSEKVPTSHVATRIKTLESRLKFPSVPGARRLRNLEKKLLQAIVRLKIDRWKKIVDDRYNCYLMSVFKCNTLPDWAKDDSLTQLLSPLPSLSPSMRRLALQIFINRTTEPPWDMRARADNKRFIQSMHELNINMDPWLDNAPIMTRIHNRKTIEFTLERDPLEVLSMGAHFQTCLSPGEFNYFSVFANAADINKQVLYGRDTENGKVAARCLLALTDSGGVVKFHPYRHDNELNFEEISTEYVTLLADNMDTVAIRNGNISKLVARDWYDDGVIDIEERFSALSDDRVTQHLRNCYLHEVLQFLQCEIAPLQIDEFTLPHLLALSVFDQRPELILPLFTLIDRNTSLSRDSLFRTAKLLSECKRYNEIKQIMPRLIKNVLAHGRDYWSERDTTTLHLLLPVSASTVLWLLKKTRPPGIRKWDQESDPDRLYLGSLANLKLNRQKMARRLLECAISRATGQLKKHYERELGKMASVPTR